MTAKHKCSEKVPEGGRSVSFYPCQRPATVQRDGKRYCWQHDPEYVAKKATERRAAWEAKGDREAAKYARIARNARLGALVTPELPALLEKLANYTQELAEAKIDVYAEPLSSYIRHWLNDAKLARALAARIREALALEANDGEG